MNTQYPNHTGTTLIFTGIGITIALGAGFRAFYSRNDNWKIFKTQRLAVSFVVRRWELALLPLAHDPGQNSQKALDATVAAVGDIERVLEHEQDIYFGGVKLPEDILKRKDEAEGRSDKPDSGGRKQSEPVIDTSDNPKLRWVQILPAHPSLSSKNGP